MNEHRFIELLNLYLDHQIDAEDAAELEAEVVRNPARRRIYDQYCRLHRGCTLLYERERTRAPAASQLARSLLEAERKISAPCRRTWNPAHAGLFAVSAMAACVAIVVVTQRGPSQGEALRPKVTTAANNPAISTRVETIPAAFVTETPTRMEGVTAPKLGTASFDLQPVLVASSFGVARNAREAEIASTDPEALEWMKRVDLLPMQNVLVDEQAFEGRQVMPQENRVFRSRHALQGNAEFTAYQFQR